MSSEENKNESPAPAASPNAPPSGGLSKMVLMLTGFNIVLCLAIGAFLFISWKKERERIAVEDMAKAVDQPNNAVEGEHASTEEGAGEHGSSGGEHGGGEHGASSGHGGGSKKKMNAEFKTVQLDQFVVNLLTPGGIQQKFVRANISLAVPDDNVESEVTTKMPQVRNAIIDIFNSKRPTDLSSLEGRDFLKSEILNTINSFLNSGKLKGVFITNFAVTG